jgi:hypothetical protein
MNTLCQSVVLFWSACLHGCFWGLPVTLADSTIALTVFMSDCHLCLSPSTFLPSLSGVDYSPRAYERSQYLLPRAALMACLSIFHLGHANRKCGTVSVILYSHLSVSAMLIFRRYVMNIDMSVLSWTNMAAAVLWSALYIFTVFFPGSALSISWRWVVCKRPCHHANASAASHILT